MSNEAARHLTGEFIALCREHGVEFYRDPFGTLQYRKPADLPTDLAATLKVRWTEGGILTYLERVEHL